MNQAEKISGTAAVVALGLMIGTAGHTYLTGDMSEEAVATTMATSGLAVGLTSGVAVAKTVEHLLSQEEDED